MYLNIYLKDININITIHTCVYMYVGSYLGLHIGALNKDPNMLSSQLRHSWRAEVGVPWLSRRVFIEPTYMLADLPGSGAAVGAPIISKTWFHIPAIAT